MLKVLYEIFSLFIKQIEMKSVFFKCFMFYGNRLMKILLCFKENVLLILK